jgi:hypothetical protein
MRMKKILTALLIVLLGVFAISCKKNPGPGGRAMVKGKLLSGNFHSPDVPVGQDDGEPDERVYLIYGDRTDGGLDDDQRTSHNGSFEFKFLRKGKYQLFAYSQDPNLPSSSSQTPVIREFEITSGRETIDIDDLIIYKAADRGGTSTIRGKVWAKDWNATFTQLKGEYYAADEWVYIKFGNSSGYNRRVRTSFNGTYEFVNLRKGRYTVFAYSKDQSQTSISGNVEVIANIEITDRNTLIEIDDLVINK